MECLKIPFLCNSLRIFNERSLPNNYFIISIINGNSKVLQVILNILRGCRLLFLSFEHLLASYRAVHIMGSEVKSIDFGNFECLKLSSILTRWALPCQEAMYQSDFLHTDPAPAVRFVTLYNQGDHHPPAKCKNKDGKSSILLSKITSQFTRFCIYENSWLS